MTVKPESLSPTRTGATARMIALSEAISDLTDDVLSGSKSRDELRSTLATYRQSFEELPGSTSAGITKILCNQLIYVIETIQPTESETTMQDKSPFEYVVHNGKDIVVSRTEVMARDDAEVKMIATRAIPEKDAKDLSSLVVVVRPFR